MHRHTLGLALAAALITQVPLTAGTIHVVGDTANSEHGLGNFSATLTYTSSDSSNATLVVTLTNTTNPAIGGYITALVLNNPGNAITGITQSEVDLELLGTAPFQDGINAAPFGQFDFGVGTGGGFEGGGPPGDGGLGVAETGSVTFTLTGGGLDLLSVNSFVNELSVGPGDGQGHQFMVARFRGMEEEPGSDKVPGKVEDTPEPATLLLGLIGMGALAGSVGRRRLGRVARS